MKNKKYLCFLLFSKIFEIDYFILKILLYSVFSFCYILFEFHLHKKKKKFFIPKISIFLPIYNKEQYLLRSIYSIQNQSLKDIEIIAVNDYSTDNSLKILKNLAKEDSRIRIINNDKNHGLLYSRAIGILNSSGEYLINLDPDDELNEYDSLEYLYSKAKNHKLDLLSYGVLFKSENKTIFKCSNYNNILKQPKLLQSAFNRNINVLEDFLIWNKFVKKELFKKAYELFKVRIFAEKWNYHEDNIWSILINKYAKSMLCINKSILIHYTNEDSLISNRGNILEMENILYRNEMYRKILTKKYEKKYIIGELLELMYKIENHEGLIKVLKKNIDLRNKLNNILPIYTNKYKCPYYIIHRIKNIIK